VPLTVRIDADRELLLVEGTGSVTDADLLRYIEEYLSDDRFRSYDELFDLSQSDLLDLTYAGLSKVASQAAATDPTSAQPKIAILVSETLGIGLSRLYQSLREVKGGRRETRVFLDGTECREWLGLPP